MFRLVYSGEGATQPLVDDSSLTKEQKWQLLFDRNWRNLAPSSQTKWLVYLRKWKKWIDDHPEQPEGYLVLPSNDEAKFPSQPYIAGVTSRAKAEQKPVVGLCVAAMVSCGLAASFRSDDLQDTRY
ncbi:hypothetical protein WJX77_009991 [Trebouxia sp. C0004]